MKNQEKQAAIIYWIKWRKMAGMRDVLIHNHADVDYHIVWKAATVDIPDLMEQIKQVLNDEFKH